MKIGFNSLKGAWLLLFGMAATGAGRGLAADIQYTSFDKLASNSSEAVAGEASTGPFKEESPSPLAAAIASSPCQGEAGVEAMPCCDDCYMGTPGRFWFHADYMHWWTSAAHVPPLVETVTDLTNPTQTLQTVFGDRDVGGGDRDGYRLDLGMWLDCCHRWGVEGEYFDFSGRPLNYDSGVSNGYNNGNLFPLVRSTSDPINGTQVFPVAVPNQYVGRATVNTSDYFQSAGIWLRRNLRASEWAANGGEGIPWTDAAARTFRLDAIAGYRFTRLIDSVDVRDDEFFYVPPQIVTDTSIQYTNVDNFRAVNNFNGGELGLDATMTRGRWSMDVLFKAALGVNNQDVQLFGLVRADRSVTGGGIQQQILAPEYSRNVFSWIPELTVTAGYQLTERIKVTVGYDIMYWSAVARSGNQIVADPATGLPMPIDPATFTIQQTFFWAQGVRLGGEVRF